MPLHLRLKLFEHSLVFVRFPFVPLSLTVLVIEGLGGFVQYHNLGGKLFWTLLERDSPNILDRFLGYLELHLLHITTLFLLSSMAFGGVLHGIFCLRIPNAWGAASFTRV